MSHQELKNLIQKVRAIALDDMPTAVSPTRLYEELNSQYPSQRGRISKVNIFVKSLLNSYYTK
jgi:hypothetical protein